MAQGRERASQRRDHRLSLRTQHMARMTILPGEHLAEELKAIGARRRCRTTSTSRSTESLGSSAVRVRSPPTPRSGSATDLAPAPSSGSTCRSSTSCAGRMPTSAPLWNGCPPSGGLAREEHAPRRGCASARSTAHYRGLNQENARNRLSIEDNPYESSTEPSAQASQAGNSKGTMSMGDVVVLREEVAPKRQLGSATTASSTRCATPS